MEKNSKIYVAGHRGLVGSAIVNNLKAKGYTNVMGKTHAELDLLDQQAVASFFESEKPEYVFLAAAKVGGIVANNTYRADFIYENLQVQNNIIHQCYKSGVKKLMFLGSTCIYPKNAPQPMPEDCLLTDTLEYTNEPYAIAKIAGIKMCESYNLQYGTNYISVMPTNLYGPNDNFDLETSHVLPALIRKIHCAKLLNEGKYDEVVKDLDVKNIGEAKEYLTNFGVDENKVEIWGSGKPMREFLWSEDMADACVFIMENRDFTDTYSMTDGSNTTCTPLALNADTPVVKTKEGCNEVKNQEIRNTHINIGTGIEISIHDLAHTIKEIVGFSGELYFNADKPDGTMKKLTNVSKLHGLGWKHTVELKSGIEKMYNWYRKSN